MSRARKQNVYVKWDEVNLRKLYWDDGLTSIQIGVLYGVGDLAVRNAMERRAIPRRSSSETRMGKRNYRWSGGRYKNYQGYMMVLLHKGDFFFQMATDRGRKGAYAREHRLLMAKHLGRNLHRWEIVHHKNGIRDDNRIENLQLVSDDRHNQITILENRIASLEKKLAEVGLL